MLVKDYDPIIAILRSQLLANQELASFIGTWTDADTGANGKAIYPAYIDSMANPVYPALTICKEFGRTLKNDSGFDQNRYYIHGWVKTSPSDAAYLNNLVVATLDLQPIPGLVRIRKIDNRCPLYDSTIMTHYFMSEWLIYANQSLIYA